MAIPPIHKYAEIIQAEREARAAKAQVAMTQAGAMSVPPPYKSISDTSGTTLEHFSDIVKAHRSMAEIFEFIAAQASMDLFKDKPMQRAIYERILVLGYQAFCKESQGKLGENGALSILSQEYIRHYANDTPPIWA